MTAPLVTKHICCAWSCLVESDGETFVLFMMQGLEFTRLPPPALRAAVTLGYPCPQSPPWDQGWGVGGEGWPRPPAEAAPR